jgi:hypothetical protein
MQRRSGLRAAGWACAAASSAALALLLLTHGTYQGALIGALIAAVCGAASRHHLTRASKQGVGARSEQLVSNALGRCPGAYHVLNNVVLPGTRGDCDHLALTSRGAVCIETKAGGGTVKVVGGKLITGRNRVCPGDPVGQCLAQASAAARLLKVPVAAVVVFPWMASSPFRHRGVWVCGTKELGWVLQRLGQGGHMTSAEADWCAARVRR